MIFDEQISRKPNNYPWTKDFITAMRDGFWTDKEFTFMSDLQNFKVDMTEQEKQMIVRCLSAIGQIEIAVKVFWAKLGDNLPQPCFSDLGFTLANVECIHNDAYERLLTVLGLDDIFEENLKLEWVQGRVKYLKKYTHKFYKDNKKQYLYAIILFSLFVENVSLFSQFYIVKWFRRFKNLLKDTNQQVSYTIQEETTHFLVGARIIQTAREEYPELFDKELEDRVLSEAKEAFKAEAKIVDWMIGGFAEDNLNTTLLKEFIKNRINDSLLQIGFNSVFEIDKQLLDKSKWFDVEAAATDKTDFFNSRPTGYQKKNQSFAEEDLF
jgi:ribonucleoside-diphosphate reductase beta chain